MSASEPDINRQSRPDGLFCKFTGRQCENQVSMYFMNAVLAEIKVFIDIGIRSVDNVLSQQ